MTHAPLDELMGERRPWRCRSRSPAFVIRYDYLWLREASVGRDQGKDRPACLVAASDSSLQPRFVVILPITHSPPSGDTVGIEIPSKVRPSGRAGRRTVLGRRLRA